MKDLVAGILALNANAKIIWFTPIPRITEFTANAAGNKLQAYRDAIILYANSRGDAYLDLGKCGINPQFTNTLNNWFVSSDGIHPNDKGHSIFIAPKVTAFLKNEITN